MTPGTFGRVCEALLAEGRTVRFRASGLSMEPAIRDGDVLTVEPPAGGLAARRGDVVLFRSGTRLLAHRVVSVDRARGVLVCQGDLWSCGEEDVPAASVLGTVVAVSTAGDPAAPPAPRRELARLLGRLRGGAGRAVRALAMAARAADDSPRA